MIDSWSTPGHCSTSTSVVAASASGPHTPTKRASRHSRISNDVEHSSFVRSTSSSSSSSASLEYKIGDAVLIDGTVKLKQKFLHPPPYLADAASNRKKQKKGKKRTLQERDEDAYEGWQHVDGLAADDKVAVITRLYEDPSGGRQALVRWFARPGAVWGPEGPDEEELGAPTLPYELYYTADSTHLSESRALRERALQNPFASPSKVGSSKKRSRSSPAASRTSSSSFISAAASSKTPLHSDVVPLASIKSPVKIMSFPRARDGSQLDPATSEMQRDVPTFFVRRVYDVKPVAGAGFWAELVDFPGAGGEGGVRDGQGALGGWDRLRARGVRGWERHEDGERKAEGWDVEPAMEEDEDDEGKESDMVMKERKRKEKGKATGNERTNRKDRVEDVSGEMSEGESSDSEEEEGDDFAPGRASDASSDEEGDSSSGSDSSEPEDGVSDSDGEEMYARTPTKRRRKTSQLPTPTRSRASSAGATPTKRKRGHPAMSASPTKTRVARVLKRRTMGSKAGAKSTSARDAAHNPLPPLLSPAFLASLPTPLERAKALLHVSATPDTLPCREEQRDKIRQFIGDAVLARTGGCLYVHGVPGTGKTATVHSVVRELQNDADMDAFTFVEINGMKISEPTAAFSHLWTALSASDSSMKKSTTAATGKVSPKVALANLEGWFANPDPARKTTVVLVDELDQMLTKRQDVLYNFFNWPHCAHSRLVVIAVANTMDLPERELSGKIRSRLGTNRIPFQPYTWNELKRILEARLSLVMTTSAPPVPVKLFDDVALQKIAKSVAGISGDARKALDVARRTLDRVALRRGRSATVDQDEEVRCTIQDATAAYNDMTKNGPGTFIRRLSLHQKVLLLALAQCIRRAGVPEVELDSVLSWHDTFLRQTHLLSTTLSSSTSASPSSAFPSKSELLTLVSHLHAMRLVATESQRLDVFQRVRAAVDEGDVFAALREDDLLKNHVPHA
ncbi:hypothetical protein JCM10212_000341 [Sporobolomyces blumeae]